jgi:hypothetical protein
VNHERRRRLAIARGENVHLSRFRHSMPKSMQKFRERRGVLTSTDLGTLQEPLLKTA